MPRKLPVRPKRPSQPLSHIFLRRGTQLKRSLIRRPAHNIELTAVKRRPPKIMALEEIPRIPLSTNTTDHARRLARIEQIKQLYSPKEFKRLRDQQLQLVLPESPLKTTRGRIGLGLLVWLYASIVVYLRDARTKYRYRVCNIRIICIRRNNLRVSHGISGRIGEVGCPRGYYMIRRMMILILWLLRTL